MQQYVLVKGSELGGNNGKTELFSTAESFRSTGFKVGNSFCTRRSLTTFGEWGIIIKAFEGKELEDLNKVVEQIGYERTCALFSVKTGDPA